jgi:single-stranded-DNA-specific exonuclease
MAAPPALPPLPAMRIFSAPRDRAQERLLQQELGVPPAVAAVLVRRGYSDPVDAEKFLNPKLDDLGDPRLLPDYEIAEAEILGARERGERIFIHGDYDADGVTSAALFTRFLEAIKCDVQVHVPHRMKEGYGIHLSAVEKAREAGAKLFLTCDVGISAHEQVEAAREAGMRVVVTDHHTVGPTLPNALAVVNPHRADSEYPFQELCGAGVVFRLCEGLARSLDLPVDKYRQRFLDLAVVGTIADVMPLLGENRIIARHGLAALSGTERKGLIALKRVAELLDNTKLKSYHIGFQIGPRLNATGRIDDAARALQLLLTRDTAEADKLADEIDKINTERQAQQREMVDQAVAQVMEMELESRYAIVVGNPDWHPGIVGLVASRLVEVFRRPAFAYTVDPETGRIKGSARSIPGFHLANAIRANSEIMDGGGHAMAAGFSAPGELFDEVEKALNDYAASVLTPEDFQPVVEVDAEVTSSEITFREIEALEMLEPFGQANPTPVFCTRGCVLYEMTPTKNGSQKVRVSAESGPALTGFYPVLEAPEWFSPKMTADVIFVPELNEWQGMRTVQWKIRHIEPVA